MNTFDGWTVYQWRPRWEHGQVREIHRDVASRIFDNWWNEVDAVIAKNGHSFHAGYVLKVSEATQVEVVPVR